MEKIRSFCSKWYILCTLILITLFYSCKKSDAPQVADLKGEEIFRGIYFGEGKVATSLKEYVPNFSEWLEDSDKKLLFDAETGFINKINQKHPGFFNHFETEIKSGDVGRVKVALIGATKALREAAESNNDIADIKVNKDEQAKLLKQMDADNVKGMKKEQLTALLKTEKYKEMLAKAFGSKSSSKSSTNLSAQEADLEEAASKDVNRNLHRGVETYVYVEVVLVLVVAVAAVFAAILGETEPVDTLDPEGPPADDAPVPVASLKTTQFLSTVTKSFAH
ncbi:hypothetical protein GCM10022289_00410 [Pedobacter jeongneungensis]|uniref:SdpC family antimicrobial peptide n=1 Tax=Pedobacter jeongneungensis TaxID=947309 RepID=A0ABP8B1V1_9SPHI